MIEDTSLWASLPVPALLLDQDDLIVESNPAAESFLNLSAKSLVGKSLWEKVLIDAPLEAAFGRARDGRTPLFVNDVDVGSGERPPMQCNIQIAPHQGNDGLMIMMISPREIASRMTKSHNTGKAAKSAIGMAEMLAHEIKNPLAGITGAAQLLAMGLSVEDQELTDLIVEESKRIVSLLDQVEQFGDVTPPNCAHVNIHDVLDRAARSAVFGFAGDIQIHKTYDPSLPEVWADADQMVQVFLNLVKNACEALGPEGKVTIRTFYDPSLRLPLPDGTGRRLPLHVEIIDNGPGLPKELANHVFEPFVTTKNNGKGLGLALVSKIIAQHRAWISVASQPGHTIFRVSLSVHNESRS